MDNCLTTIVLIVVKENMSYPIVLGKLIRGIDMSVRFGICVDPSTQNADTHAANYA